MIYIISLIVIIYFFIEVLLGSSVGVYNSEIGYESSFQNAKKVSLKQFFFEFIPICIIPMSLLFLIYHF
jgi:hypothetical protein